MHHVRGLSSPALTLPYLMLLGMHHCAPVKKWLATHQEQIEVFYLPSYSPELNPDERLNGDLKQDIESRVPCRTKDTPLGGNESHDSNREES